MKTKKISIIIPVYNAEQYLEDTINSILEQTYQDFELILVDDGSTDHSPAICQRYAKADDRITCYTKKNQGVSAARNDGIQLANGKYIRFVDADDRLPKDSLELLLQPVQKEADLDLVIGAYDANTEEFYKGSQQGTRRMEEIIGDYLHYIPSFYYGVVWNKLYRRELIEEAQIRFDPQMPWSEDLLFNLEYMAVAKKGAYVQQSVYEYIQREQSLTKQTEQYEVEKTTAFEIRRFQAVREMLQKKEMEAHMGQLYTFYLGRLNHCLNEWLMLPGRSYQSFVAYLSQDGIQEILAGHEGRDPYPLNQFLADCIKRKQYGRLYAYYAGKHWIKKNRWIHRVLQKQTLTREKFQL